MLPLLLLLSLLLLLLLLLLQVIPVKANYNYFTLYKASSLNLEISWSKRVSFYFFLQYRKFLRRSHRSRFSAIVRSDAICFYWNEWMKIDRSFFIYKSCPVTYKINYYSWSLSRGTSRLIKWIYKKIGIALTEKKKKITSLITDSLQTTKMKLMSC